MTDHFDKWINSMSDDDYIDFLDEDGTDAQIEKALNIRDRPTEEELDELEREQEFKEREEILEQREQLVEEREKQVEITIKQLEEVKELPIEKLKPALTKAKIKELIAPITIKGLPIPKEKPALPSRLIPLPLPTPKAPVIPLSNASPVAVIPKALPALPLPRPSVPTVVLKAPVTGVRQVARTAVTAIKTGFSILRRIVRL